ncbi:MAG TPA: CBS domain-containing protein, partial [Actinospica sp.]|nr:CBS domain-containing protein [Actinospica sp.]
MNLPARKIMAPIPITARSEAPIQEVARIMRDESVGAVLIVDGTELVGVVTDRDLAVRALAAVAAGFAGTLIAAHAVHGPGVARAAAAPLLLAGIGSGLVIAPNQTITLSEVPVREASTAAGVLQTAQRIGSAVGIAAVGLVFFGALPGGGRSTGSGPSGRGSGAGPWSAAFERGLAVILVLVG